MPADPLVGQSLGDYEIHGLLRDAGSSRVYLATQKSLGRGVALKVVPAERADQGGYRGRFLAQARVAALIEHPNVLPVYDTGEAEGVLYVARSLVDGMDLGELLDRVRRLPPARAVHIVTQVACALDAAHARGVVHRDVTPRSVLLAENDRAYLTDFGTAMSTPAPRKITRSGAFVGTLGYASPEQIRNKPISGATDVYSLACVLFECLTGAQPFEGRDPEAVMTAQLEDPPARASQYGLSKALDAVFAEALAKAADDRFGSASAFVSAARDALEAPSAAVAPMGHDPGMPRVWPRPVFVIGAVALTLVASGALVSGRSAQTPAAVPSAPLEVTATLAVASAAAPTAEPTVAKTVAPPPTVAVTQPSTPRPATPQPTAAPRVEAVTTPSPSVAPAATAPPTVAPPPTQSPSPTPMPTLAPSLTPIALLAPGMAATPIMVDRGQGVAFLLSHFSPGLDLVLTVRDAQGFVRQTMNVTIGPNGGALALPYYTTKTTDPTGTYHATIDKGGLLLSVGFQVN